MTQAPRARLHRPAPPRTIVVGDVHGCLEELDELVKVVEVRRGVDRLVFAGDLMDRGPDPAGVVRRVRELGAECVRGNHEDRHLRWAKHQARCRVDPRYVNPMCPLPAATLAQHEALREEDLAWMTSLPVELDLGDDWVVVHAGFTLDRPRDAQKPATLMRVRWVDAEGRMVPVTDARQCPPGSARWATRWAGPECVVYGHDVQSLAAPVMHESAPGVWCCGIDTGCAFGGRLTAMEVPTRRVWQVTAKRRYAGGEEGDEG